MLVKRMSNFTRETLRELQENLQTAFKDWTSAKEGLQSMLLHNTFHYYSIMRIVFLNLDNVVIVASDKVRREMDIKLNKTGEDLRRMSSMYENSCEQLNELQATLKGLMQVLSPSI
jgi:hypothetical protein